MGCGQCSSGGCGSIKPAKDEGKTNYIATKGCGSSGGSCSTGCTKLNSFDWLSDMELPAAMRYNVVEVKFKGGRKEYFRNTKNLQLYTGDFVVCDMPTGYHIGTVSLQGELVRLQLIKKGISDNDEIRSLMRVANERDMEKHEQAINRDLSTMYRTRELVKDFGLKMKVSDVEFQSDNSKATFYYSADDRVDFRELIKALAGEFRIRVEMRQISLRQEASRLGGIGSCGRELCCSTWLSSFKSIPTAAARYQNLSLNPAKLSGQCGRLKCCLNYELDTYVDALQGIPKLHKPLMTEKGEAYLQKTDIFRRLMWFSFKNDSNWYSISCSQVIEIVELNKKGKKPMTLENMSLMEDFAKQKPASVNNELEKLDRKLSKANPSKAKKKKKPNKKRGNSQQANANTEAKPEARKPRGGGNRPKPKGGKNPQNPNEAQAQAQGNKPNRNKNKRRNNRNRPPKKENKGGE
ncbi:PSP1 domain-containing protein [Jiulongibacter sp. NS-SX5]|uniref:PSP1 domain-containing protein n=1 Tax=Jiulongibacter sp. NS-SX5 TaxID=3463854 RepID=UPI004058EF76